MVDDAVFGGGHRRQGSADLSTVARHRRQGSGDFANLRLGRTASGTFGLSTPAGVSTIKTCASSRRTTAKLEVGCRLVRPSACCDPLSRQALVERFARDHLA